MSYTLVILMFSYFFVFSLITLFSA